MSRHSFLSILIKKAQPLFDFVSPWWALRSVRYASVAVLLVAGYFAVQGIMGGKELQTVTIKSSGIGAVVSVQGSVVPSREVSLGFESSGKIVSVPVRVGDRVGQGQVLAALSQEDLRAQVASLEATRDAAQARLDDLRLGTRVEDIAIAESQLASAKNQYAQARVLLAQTLEDAYNKLDDAVRSKTDQFFNNPQSASPTFALPADSQTKLRIESARARLESAITKIQSSSFSNPTETDIALVRTAAEDARAYLDDIAIAINKLNSISSLPAATIDGYKASVTSARSTVSTYTASLTSAHTGYTTQEASVLTAQSQLALKKAGATKAEIDAQAAQVRAAEANIRATEALLSKRVIYAPFAGVVTAVDFKPGAIVGSGTGGTITLITAHTLQIESFVPEVYIAKIALGDTAEITLDAYPATEIFKGKVALIDPSSTEREGVATYKTTIVLDTTDDRVRAGMNGDVVIKASKSPVVITVPKKALVIRNGLYFVQIPAGDGRVVEREVQIGQFNEADVAEVIEGLSDGDVIVTEPVR